MARPSAYGFSEPGVICEVHFEEAIKALDDAPRLLRHAIRGSLLTEATKFTERKVRPRFTQEGTKNKNLSDKVRDRTGKLPRSFKPFSKGEQTYGRKEQNLGSIYAGVRSKHPLAHIHEFGAKPKPVKGKYIAIPLADARTANGKQKGNPGDWNNTFIRRSAAGHLIVFGPRNPRNTLTKTGKTRKAYPLFLLVKQAEIPARTHISKMMIADRQKWLQGVERGVGHVATEWQNAKSVALGNYPRAM